MPSSEELGTLHNNSIRTAVRPIPIHTTRGSCLNFRTLALGAYDVPHAALAIALHISALRIRGKVVERLAVQGPLQCIVVAPHDVDVRGIARAFFHQVLRPCGGAAATSPLLGDFFCSATARLQVICRRTLLSPDFYMLPREGSENTTTHLRRRGRQGTHRARATADGHPASMSGSVSQYASSSRQQQSSVASV